MKVSRRHRNLLPLLLSALTIFITTTSLHAQRPLPSSESMPESSETSLKVDTQEARNEITTQLSSPDLTDEKRAEIITKLEAQRDALLDEYLTQYRKIIRETHKLHPQDPWLAAEKIQKALEAKAPLAEQQDALADILDEHSPVMRPNTDAQLHAQLAKLPHANREFIEATQAALRSPLDSFQALATAQARLQANMVNEEDTNLVEDTQPPRDTPARQAYLRRLHQNLLETDPENTPSLAEFLDSQSLSRIFNAPNSKPEKQ